MIEYWQQADMRESWQDPPRRRAATPLPTAPAMLASPGRMAGRARRARQARTRRRQEQELAATAPRVSSMFEIQRSIDPM